MDSRIVLLCRQYHNTSVVDNNESYVSKVFISIQSVIPSLLAMLHMNLELRLKAHTSEMTEKVMENNAFQY